MSTAHCAAKSKNSHYPTDNFEAVCKVSLLFALSFLIFTAVACVAILVSTPMVTGKEMASVDHTSIVFEPHITFAFTTRLVVSNDAFGVVFWFSVPRTGALFFAMGSAQAIKPFSRTSLYFPNVRLLRKHI